MTMIYQPRDFDSEWEDGRASEDLETWISVHGWNTWFRVDNEPVRLIYFTIDFNSRIANALVRYISGEFCKVSIARLEVIDPSDDARNASLVCPECGGEGEVHRLNNPTGERCSACFGTGLFLRSLY